MEQTNNLALPYIMPSQAQKHVTHNEALRILDTIIQTSVKMTTLQTPPVEPVEGDRYIIADGATDGWQNHDKKIATFVDGTWLFVQPLTGWRVYAEDTETMLIYKDSAWQSLMPEQFGKIGVNTIANDISRLSVETQDVLLSYDSGSASGDMNLKINKALPPDEAMLSFDRAWNSKAIMGLLGNDNLSVKVSPDGASYKTAVEVAADNGKILYNESIFSHSTLNVKGMNLSGTADGYFCFTVTNTNADMTNKGGAVITCAPYDNSDTPWMVLGPWSTASGNVIYYGGGGWGVPDATEHRFYSGPYQPDTPNTSTLALNIVADSIISSRDILPDADDSYALGSSSKRWSEIYSATNLITTSDIRTKEDIEDCELGMEFISKLRPVSFHKKGTENDADATRHYGLIAQQVQGILELFAAKNFGGWIGACEKSPDMLQGLRYEQFIPPLIKAVQELSAKVDQLQHSKSQQLSNLG